MSLRLTLSILSCLCLTLCVACTRDDTPKEDRTPSSASEDSKRNPAIDAADDDEVQEDLDRRKSAPPSPSKAEETRGKTGPGPKKVARPTGARARNATSGQDASSNAQASKSHEQRNPKQEAGTAAQDAKPVENDEDTASEEAIRQFDFDGSDDELEMILGTRPIPPFHIDDLLTLQDLRASLGAHTPAELAALEGQTPSPYYNHRWFRSSREGRMGVVFQYWHFQTPTAAKTHYDLMESTAAFSAQPVGVASQGFYTEHENTVALVALSLDLPAVISLTCDVETCHVPQLMRWIQLIETRARE